MNRTIKVARINDPQSPTGISIRVEIYEDIHAAPVEALTVAPDEAIELASILHLLQYNNSLTSITGSVGGLRVAEVTMQKGGAS